MNNLYWGEMHTHTYCGGPAFGTIEEAVNIAQTHLDFWSSSEHCGPNHPQFLTNWKNTRSVIAASNVVGKFVTFNGYESGWIGHGDYNIYFRDDSIHEPLVTSDFEEYVNFARQNKAILIPHHGAYRVGYRGTDWGDFDSNIMPLVEIFSMHGSSEREDGRFPMDLPWMGPRESGGTVLAGLERGIKIGFMASSDGHGAYPGCYRMGLTGVYSPKLTRNAIWDAFLARRTYAVTGDRIKLDFQINGQPMGSEINSIGKREIYIAAGGESMLNEIDIIKNGQLWRRETCAFKKKNLTPKIKLRVEWGWGDAKIRRWEGQLKVLGGKIRSYNPNFGSPAPNYIVDSDDDRCQWISHTVGSLAENSGELNLGGKWRYARNGREGTNQIVFEIEGNSGTEVVLVMNGQKWQYRLTDLIKNSKVELFHDESTSHLAEFSLPKIKLHQVVSQDRYQADYRFIDDKPQRQEDYYYARITQDNGQMAWSSPIWVC